ncbi:F-box/LRR-repeat protein 6 isoform X2 [Bacillus rossius redtenbacheri]|uniref:F-box/LRR-repeat protein 6 isoform X2 n=1 Tax=Bacillus rossius redtenbacheri TaxID=93214 RepID=UPI002FDD997D
MFVYVFIFYFSMLNLTVLFITCTCLICIGPKIFSRKGKGKSEQVQVSPKQEKNILETHVQGGWKYITINFALESICHNCTELTGLGLNGWEGLTADHVKYLIANCPGLARLDLSSINPESANSRGALSLGSLTHLAQEMGERLTHLVLADNTLSGLPQIINALATYCPGLQVLDLSNLRTYTTAHLHIERLQEGCQNLRVLRITNSTVCLAQATLQEQAAAPGFPALEELSAAGLGGNVLCSNPVMDDSSIERILKNSYKLRLLDVRGGARVTDSSLVRVPAWDLEHLFLSGCCITRGIDSGLELVVQKWSHSLKEVDLAWSTATAALDSAVQALAERGEESPLRILNLCGSSVSLGPVKEVLTKCPHLGSLNLSSCRALPRGMKRLYEGPEEVAELRSSFVAGEAGASPEQERERNGRVGAELILATGDVSGVREHGGAEDDAVVQVG